LAVFVVGFLRGELGEMNEGIPYKTMVVRGGDNDENAVYCEMSNMKTDL